MTVEIIHGDCLAALKTLPSDSVHCAVTSPPYWGLRDYGVDGQIGLERSLAEHIDLLVDVFSEVRRVLRKDGTLWLNYGDAYASAPNGRSAADTKTAGNDDRTFRDKPISTVGPVYRPDHESGDRRGKSGNKGSQGQAAHTGRNVAGGFMKPKDRMMLPARVAIALQEAGWWLRDEIIWHKPNPMPSSVKDRTTPAHEMMYLLTKSPRYYFDHDAIREEAGRPKAPGPNSRENVDRVPRERKVKVPGGWDKGDGAHGTVHRGGRTAAEYVDAETDGKRAKRSVWTIPPKGFKDAHFATFPPDLIRPCILAGCPEGGTVLDPFFGAGTTGLVANELGRNCIGIELNAAYIEIARKRLGMPYGVFA